MNKVAAALLIAALLGAQGLQILGGLLAPPATKDHAHGTETLIICSHHPQGCPKDCMCPKIHSEDGGAPAQRMTEPTLSQCTEKGFAHSHLAFAPVFSSGVPSFAFADPGPTVFPREPSGLSSTSPDSLEKIPIA